METIEQPAVLAMPFANNGTKNSLPTAATGTGAASLAEGFPLLTSTSITDNGVPPSRADMNGLGYVSTAYAYLMQCGGVYTYRDDVATTIGGYPLNALLWYIPTNGIPNLLRSSIANNTNNFNEDSSVIGEEGSGKPWEIVTVTPTNFVTTNTAQTISGAKTFTDEMITDDILSKGSITLGTSTNTWGKQLQFRDTTGKRIARIQPMAVTTTNNRVGMWVNNADNTTEKGIYVDSDGTTSAPTPSAGDNSTKIATTAFVTTADSNLQTQINTKANTTDVVNLTGTQTITGTKTFNGDLLLSNGGTITRITQQGDGNFCIYKDDIAILATGTGSEKKLLAPSNHGGTVENHEVVTTEGINKNQNGYVCLGNGIIIQWGWHSGSGSTLTFPTPFTSTNYSVTANYRKQSSSGSGIGHVNFYPTSTTSCYFNSQGGDFQWIAIGY